MASNGVELTGTCHSTWLPEKSSKCRGVEAGEDEVSVTNLFHRGGLLVDIEACNGIGLWKECEICYGGYLEALDVLR